MWIIEKRFLVNDEKPPREGGMAEVYAANDKKEDFKKVAIKLFKPDARKRELVRAAFAREVGALIELGSHPNIVKVIDHGTDEITERQFIALDWYDRDLSQILGPDQILGWDDFYERFGRKILDALSFAQARNIIHRDVKPSNVLIDEYDTIFVADFGIAKFSEYYGSDLTLRDYASIPYAPPERDSGEYEATKDVHGFAVLAIECTIGRELQGHADLYQAFNNEFDAPDEIHKIFQECISLAPVDRPSDITEVYDRIEATQRERRANWIEPKRINLLLSENVQTTLFHYLSESNAQRVNGYAEQDINEIFAISKVQYKESDELVTVPDQYWLIGAGYRYLLQVSKDRDLFWVNKIVKLPSAELDYQRDLAWRPADVEFKIGRSLNPSDGRDGISYIIEGVEAHHIEAQINREVRKGDELFFKWDSFLRFREELETKREKRIQYEVLEESANFVRLNIKSIPDDDLTDQPFFIEHEGRKIYGEVASAGESELLFYPNSRDTSDIPERGILILDINASRQAINRQKNSLDAIKFGRSLRSDLKDVLLSPATASFLTNALQDLTFYDPELDDDKKDAIQAALLTNDFLVVEGPPGTGKTKFISELVLQELKRNPRSRILLSSQTHIALDNALQRIRKTALASELDLKLVRIGRWGDPRISNDVKDLLLEASVTSWLQGVKQKSELFLETWAEDRGISRQNVSIGMAMQRLMHAKRELDVSTSIKIQIEQRVLELEEQVNYEDGELSRSEFTQIREELQILNQDLDAAKTQLLESQKNEKSASKLLLEYSDEIGEDVGDYDVSELASLSEDFISNEEDGKKLRELIEIQEEWLDRFGHSEDFFGAFVFEAQVVAGTCIGFAGRGLQNVEYDLCIIDEASKATINEVLVPISRARRWVIVGDPKQLPPFVGDALEHSDTLSKYGIGQDEIKSTILDYLETKLPAEKQKTLTLQYRMTSEIGDLISKCFYDGKLISQEHKRDEYLEKSMAFLRPVTWFSSSGVSRNAEIPCNPSFKNAAEIEIIRNLLLRINLAGKSADKKYSIAILSGYGAQIADLKRMSAEISNQLEYVDVTCNTVDSFQGQQADVAIYSVTRSNPRGAIGFLREIERLNVALSRGMLALAIVGDSQFCRNVKGQNPFADILSYISQHPDTCAISEVSR